LINLAYVLFMVGDCLLRLAKKLVAYAAGLEACRCQRPCQENYCNDWYEIVHDVRSRNWESLKHSINDARQVFDDDIFIGDDCPFCGTIIVEPDDCLHHPQGHCPECGW